MTPVQFLLAWAPVLGWAALIFYLSSIPKLDSGLGVWDFVLRKIAHMVEFGILTAFIIRACRRTWSHWTLVTLCWAAGLSSVLYAASDEIHQAFVPGRGPSVDDVVIDACGVALYLVFYVGYSKRCRSLEKA